jgi:FKBP-type peptidyl-prolyl cis-trans isomerase (trigger factor)
MGTDRLLEETIHTLLPDAFRGLLETHGIKPIIHPKVELQVRDPLTLRITFIERPTVTLKGIENIRIEKKEPKVDAKGVDRVVEALLKQEGVTPPLTDDHAKKFGIANAQKLREQIEQQLRREEETIEKQRREQLLLDQIREATVLELAPELIDEEERSLRSEVLKELERANLTLQDFLKQQGKGHEAFQKELRERATQRLRLRFGLQTLVEKGEPEITDEEMTKLTHALLASASSPEERAKLEPRLQRGSDLYEQLKWRQRVNKMIDQMLERPLAREGHSPFLRDLATTR